ncbi:MAG: hypothetical protein ACLFPE_07285 [Bacteroidales bacterium]
MKTTFFILMMMVSVMLNAGNPEYEQAMGEALKQYAACNSTDEFRQAANRFTLIAQAENSEWLPLYYYAHCYIIMSFMEEEKDAAVRDALLDEAEESLIRAEKLAPDEDEIFALRGFVYTARLVIDPMNRGQQYSALSEQMLGKALAIDPQNPRAQYMQIANQMGTASFFGQDISVYCTKAKELFEQWDQFPVDSALHPAWGKDQLSELMKSCK